MGLLPLRYDDGGTYFVTKRHLDGQRPMLKGCPPGTRNHATSVTLWEGRFRRSARVQCLASGHPRLNLR